MRLTAGLLAACTIALQAAVANPAAGAHAKLAPDVVWRAGADGHVPVFVLLREGARTRPGDYVTRRRLVRAAQLYLAAHPALAQLPCRFDVVQAEGDPQAPRITWLRDAFRLDDA